MSLFSQLRLWFGVEPEVPEEPGTTINEVNVHLRFRAELDLMKDDIDRLQGMFADMLTLQRLDMMGKQLAPREVFQIQIDGDPGVVCWLSRNYTTSQADEAEEGLIALVEHIRANVVETAPVKLDEIGVDEPKTEAAE